MNYSYNSLQNITYPGVTNPAGTITSSNNPFWYNQDDGSVRRKQEVDPANAVFQRFLEASMANNLPSYPLDSPFNNVSHYRNTVFVAIQALMNALSASNILLEIREKGLGIAAGGSYAKDQEYVPFDDHQLSDYLRSPNPADSFSSFLGQVVLQYSLTGQVLIWGVPNDFGLPVRFYVLPTALCSPAYGCNNQLYPLGAWRVQQYYPATGLMGILPGPISNTAGAIIDAREVYILKNPHPLYKWACISPMTGVNVNVDIVEMIDRSAWSIYRNGPNPKGVLTIPGAGKDQVNDVEARINEKYAGPDNAGKIWALGGHPDSRAPSYQPLVPSPDTMAYDTRSIYEALVIAGVTGQDSAVLGLRQGGSYSDRWAAMKDVRVRTYEPLLGRVADLFTHGPVRQWGLTKKGVRAAIRLPRLDDPVMSQADTNAGAADGTMSVNEIRSRRGLGPDELGLGHLPAAVRQQALLLQLEGGQLPPNPNPVTSDTLVEEPDVPNDGTALGALREGIELPDVEPVVGQNMDATGSLGPRMGTKPRQPSSRPKEKPKSESKKGGKDKGKGKKEKKAFDDELADLEEYLESYPDDSLARGLYYEVKAQSAFVGDLGGSLVPPAGTVPPKKKKKKGVDELVDEILGTGSIEEPEIEVKAELNRYSTLRTHLANLPIVHSEKLEGLHNLNEAHHVILDHPRVPFQGIFKPASGEVHVSEIGSDVPTFHSGGYHGRESAASHVAEIMGVHDLVPATTVRTHNGQRGSIQRFVPGALTGVKAAAHGKISPFGDSHEDLRRAAAFDYLVGNTDRHPGNWLVKGTGGGNKLVLIDHGHSFPEGGFHDHANNFDLHREAAFKDRATGLKAPSLVTSSYDADNKWKAVHDTLKAHGIGPTAIAETRKRFGALTSGKYTLDHLLFTPPHLLEGK